MLQGATTGLPINGLPEMDRDVFVIKPPLLSRCPVNVIQDLSLQIATYFVPTDPQGPRLSVDPQLAWSIAIMGELPKIFSPQVHPDIEAGPVV